MARGRNARRRRIGWTVAALAAAAVLSAALLLKTDAPPAPQPADAEALIDRFEKVAFRDDFIPEHRRDQYFDVLSRWAAPIRLQTHGLNDALEEQVQRFLPEIQELVGFRVWRVPSGSVTPPNMMLVMQDRDSYLDLFERIRSRKIYSRGVHGVRCFGFPNVREPSMKVSHVAIYLSPIFSEEERLACLLEEIVQGLGLYGDTSEQFDSLFVDSGPLRLDFPLNDKILLRTLYDRRLRAGMKREEAMAKVALIIPELLAAYEAEGVAGLYQPLHDPRW